MVINDRHLFRMDLKENKNLREFKISAKKSQNKGIFPFLKKKIYKTFAK